MLIRSGAAPRSVYGGRSEHNRLLQPEWEATAFALDQEQTVADTSDVLDEGFRAMSRFFVNDGTLGDTLLRVAELAVEVSPAEFAGITMIVDGEPSTGVFTDPEAPEIDEAQYQTGQGPCLEAFRQGLAFIIESTEKETRWEDFARTAADHGIVSTLSVPLVARSEGIGALNLYSRTAVFNDADLVAVEAFANQAAVVLANAKVYWDARELGENLNQALHSRSIIDYAIGILMANSHRGPEDAFQMLVRASQRENRKLRDIAAEIVARTNNGSSPSITEFESHQDSKPHGIEDRS
jgi:GAF domain-containing protein